MNATSICVGKIFPNDSKTNTPSPPAEASPTGKPWFPVRCRGRRDSVVAGLAVWCSCAGQRVEGLTLLRGERPLSAAASPLPLLRAVRYTRHPASRPGALTPGWSELQDPPSGALLMTGLQSHTCPPCWPSGWPLSCVRWSCRGSGWRRLWLPGAVMITSSRRARGRSGGWWVRRSRTSRPGSAAAGWSGSRTRRARAWRTWSPAARTNRAREPTVRVRCRAAGVRTSPS